MGDWVGARVNARIGGRLGGRIGRAGRLVGDWVGDRPKVLAGLLVLAGHNTSEVRKQISDNMTSARGAPGVRLA